MPSVKEDRLNMMDNLPSPRFIKTHLPIQLLPDEIWTVKPKLIYIKRNVKSVVVSYYFHTVMFDGYTGSLEEFSDTFMADSLLYSPYIPHILDYCQASESLDNLLVLNFEDMKIQLKEIIKIVANFLNVQVTQEDLGKLCEHLSFENMKSKFELFTTSYQYLLNIM